jgi:predicted nucleotidyltransferase
MVEAKASLRNTLVDIITKVADPDQIILFGSRATGTAHPESDYDFLVVVPHVENERRVSRRIYHALLDHQIEAAVDIVVVDQETLAQHRDTPGMIYRQALKEGEVAYERVRV